ncbi:MAG: hypothetical protein US89_C0013G0009 [Candidatus Peregrinibacteria bacterium GW2011_GWF2_38_29]|nr:MAG: hypothetical protein US89_C0013G0009 [Candidatus Peregrinibacteria bacterium GW2011_GWF2_38_29]HBB02390.1 hypothetical protein [Candidatus Peregrinibacteria bacterium]
MGDVNNGQKGNQFFPPNDPVWQPFRLRDASSPEIDPAADTDKLNFKLKPKYFADTRTRTDAVFRQGEFDEARPAEGLDAYIDGLARHNRFSAEEMEAILKLVPGDSDLAKSFEKLPVGLRDNAYIVDPKLFTASRFAHFTGADCVICYKDKDESYVIMPVFCKNIKGQGVLHEKDYSALSGKPFEIVKSALSDMHEFYFDHIHPKEAVIIDAVNKAVNGSYLADDEKVRNDDLDSGWFEGKEKKVA